MKSESLNELAALKAVGALDADAEGTAQLREFLAAADAQTKDEVAKLADAAALMAVAHSPARQPSISLKGKIMARIQAGELRAAKPAPNPFFFVGRNEGQWETLPVPGVRVKNLNVDERRGISVKLYELAPRTQFPEHHHSGPEECYVLAGDFHVEGRVLQAGDFHHAEANSDHRVSHTENGCTLLVMVTTADYL